MSSEIKQLKSNKSSKFNRDNTEIQKLKESPEINENKLNNFIKEIDSKIHNIINNQINPRIDTIDKKIFELSNTQSHVDKNQDDIFNGINQLKARSTVINNNFKKAIERINNHNLKIKGLYEQIININKGEIELNNSIIFQKKI